MQGRREWKAIFKMMKGKIYYQDFPGSSAGKEYTCNAGDPGLIPGLERSSGEGIGYPLQYSWASLVAQTVKNPPAMQETPVWFLVLKIHWRKDRLPTPVFLGFPGGSDGKESTCNAGGLDLIPELGRSPGEGNGHPLQFSCQENSMDRGAWQAIYSTWGYKELDTTKQLSLDKT